MELVMVLVLSAGGVVGASMTNSWAVQVTGGGDDAADALAIKHGFINLGQVSLSLASYSHIMQNSAEALQQEVAKFV